MRNRISKSLNDLRDNVLNKQSLFTLVFILIAIGIAYAFRWLFVLSSPYQQLITGIALQLIAGVILISDQIVINIFQESGKDAWSWLTERRMRISLLIALALSYVAALIWMALGASTQELWGGVIGILIWLALVYYIYLKFIAWVFEQIEGKREGKFTERSIFWGNAAIWFITVSIISINAYLLAVEFGQDQPVIIQVLLWVWYFIAALLILPAFLISTTFLLVVGILKIYPVIRGRKYRIFFWLGIFALWVLGMVLVLLNAIHYSLV